MTTYANFTGAEGQSLAAIHNRAATTVSPTVTKTTIYAADGTWNYSHHASVTWFKGYFYVMWSNGLVDEGGAGQRIIIRRSADFVTWSPNAIIGPIPGYNSQRVATAVGFYSPNANTLNAYYCVYEWAADALQNGQSRPPDGDHSIYFLKTYVITTTDGVSWSGPRELEPSIMPNEAPRKLANGRLIMPGHATFPYTDDPNGLGGFKTTGIYLAPGEITTDSASTLFATAAEEQWGPGVYLCEGSFFQKSDGMVVMFLRSATNRLWVTASKDNGATWMRPLRSDFTDDSAKFQFGAVGDGRFFYIGNPASNGQRNPLVFALSANGTAFDKWVTVDNTPVTMKYPGVGKGPGYGYPNLLIRNGTVYVVCSVCKEDVNVYSFALPAV
jgi:hypothetical protein